MEVVNKKDGNKNFMIIKGIEIDENDYKFKMLKNNNIENVIPIGLRVIDGEKQLYYNVTEYCKSDVFAEKDVRKRLI